MITARLLALETSFDKLKDLAKSVVKPLVEGPAKSMIEAVAQSVTNAFTRTIADLGTMWVKFDTPNLSESSKKTYSPYDGSLAGSSQLTEVMGYVMWISLAVAILSLMALGALLATRLRTGEAFAAIGRLGWILGGVLLISSASALISMLVPATPTRASGPALFLQSRLWWYMSAAAVVGVIIGGARMAWEQRAEPGRDLLKGLLTLIVVAGASVTIIQILSAASDEFSKWLLNESLECATKGENGQQLDFAICFGNGIHTAMNISGLATSPMLAIIIGLIGLIASIFQIALMIARSGMLIILTGILPLTAAFTNTEMGKGWFRKTIGWLVAFLLYKPAAAIIYATAIQLISDDYFSLDEESLMSVIMGMMMMGLSLFALPALMRLITPTAGWSMASHSGAGVATAAMPTGAVDRGRLGGGESPQHSSGRSAPDTSTSRPSGATAAGAAGGLAGMAAAYAAETVIKMGREAVQETSESAVGSEEPTGNK